MKPLEGRVAVVAGATRGCGRGIAVELGAAGATVYCTGRSVRGHPSELKRPETIDDTADQVTGAGGEGIAVRVDHTEASQVKALFARVAKERGRLDLLINDVWGGDPLTEWGVPFWKLSLDQGLKLLRQAVGSHIVTSRLGVPLMLEAGHGGLIVEVTDGDTERYRENLFYDLVKASVIRLALAMSEDLRHSRPRVAAVALTPGFLRSEAMLDYFGVSESNWRDAVAKDEHFAESETPRFAGRAVAALAADPDLAAKSGRVLASWNLAHEYGFDDVDGRRPDWGAHAKKLGL